MTVIIFSHAVVIGKKVYVTGCVGLSPLDGQLAPGGIEAETHQVENTVIGARMLAEPVSMSSNATLMT